MRELSESEIRALHDMERHTGSKKSNFGSSPHRLARMMKFQAEQKRKKEKRKRNKRK